MATASAAPSSGSVAEPSSSSSTREEESASCEMRSRLLMCAEKVERFCSIDCASPMSARNASQSGKTASAAGTGIPAWAIIPSSPVVLSATVLPPVLGPLMMSCRCWSLSARVSGTTASCCARKRFSSRGWRACFSSSTGAAGSAKRGRMQSNSAANRARGLQPIEYGQRGCALGDGVGLQPNLPGHGQEICAVSPPVPLRSAVPARCFARWSRAAPGRPSGRWSWRHAPRRRCAAYAPT